MDKKYEDFDFHYLHKAIHSLAACDRQANLSTNYIEAVYMLGLTPKVMIIYKFLLKYFKLHLTVYIVLLEILIMNHEAPITSRFLHRQKLLPKHYT